MNPWITRTSELTDSNHSAQNFGIDLYDYRIESEPMLSFIPEALHDGMTKTKFRFYMVPTNIIFNPHMTWQDITMLIEFNQIPDPTNPSPDIYMNRLRPAQKQNPCMTSHSSPSPKTKNQKWLYNFSHT